MFLAGMLVVHLVRPAHCHGVPVVCIPEDFETLMDEDVMDKKISPAVAENTNAYGESGLKHVISPKQKEPDAVGRIHYKKQVVALKP